MKEFTKALILIFFTFRKMTENAKKLYSPGGKVDNLCCTNNQSAIKKSDMQISANDRESKNTDEQPRENSDDTVLPERASSELESNSVSANASNREGDSNVEQAGGADIDIALNMGNRGHVRRMLAKFHSTEQLND